MSTYRTGIECCTTFAPPLPPQRWMKFVPAKRPASETHPDKPRALQVPLYCPRDHEIHIGDKTLSGYGVVTCTFRLPPRGIQQCGLTIWVLAGLYMPGTNTPAVLLAHVTLAELAGMERERLTVDQVLDRLNRTLPAAA